MKTKIDNNDRQCPGCAWSIKGEAASTTDKNWLKFNCASCNEEWYENVKYCKPEFISPGELYNEAASAEAR